MLTIQNNSKIRLLKNVLTSPLYKCFENVLKVFYLICDGLGATAFTRLVDMRVKIYFQKPKLQGSTKTTQSDGCRRKYLQIDVFEQFGTFQLWDVEECCKNDVNFEALNCNRDSIHLISTVIFRSAL